MDKVAIVTGASSGLGMHLAVLLANNGFNTYATMRNVDKKDDVLALAEAQGLQVKVKQLDVQDKNSVNRCITEIEKDCGQIDLLVNNAGAGFVRTTEQASEEEVEWVMDVNFKGVVRCTKAVLPLMRKQRSGHIINISSIGGLVGTPFNEIYCAAKFAVEGYTESLASYIQPNFNINFTSVEPGGIYSEFANSALAQFQQGGGMQDDEYKSLLKAYIGAAQARATATDSGVYQSSEQVAQVVVDCVLMDKPPVRMRTSPWAETYCQLKTQADPTGELLRDKVTRASFN